MAKRRSKKERIRAEKRRELKLPSANFRDIKTVVTKNSYLQDIFSYEPKLIVGDLKKTFLVVLFILLVLFAITLLYT